MIAFFLLNNVFIVQEVHPFISLGAGDFFYICKAVVVICLLLIYYVQTAPSWSISLSPPLILNGQKVTYFFVENPLKCQNISELISQG